MGGHTWGVISVTIDRRAAEEERQVGGVYCNEQIAFSVPTSNSTLPTSLASRSTEARSCSMLAVPVFPASVNTKARHNAVQSPEERGVIFTRKPMEVLRGSKWGELGRVCPYAPNIA